MSVDPVLDHLDSTLSDSLERLKDLLRIPSISTDPAYKADCDRAADWLVADLQSMGVSAEKRPTPGHPMVVGHIDGPGPHLLFYGHYDVQPVDPLDLWDNDLAGAVVVIGNAPTALFRLLERIDAGAPKPAAIIGAPVGFVGAAESKDALIADSRGVPFIAVKGRRGGSAIAAAALNALAAGLEGHG